MQKYTSQEKPRLFVFANRTDPNSIGGLTSLMNDHLDKLMDDFQIHFVGWAGNDGKNAQFAQNDTSRAYKTTTIDGIHYHTVEFTKDEYEKGYCGFQNQDIWPHSHSLPEKAAFIEGGFEINVKISNLFIKTAQKQANFNSNDYAFVNDYHLIIMGQVMEEMGLKCIKTFHNHIPIPNLKILQQSEAKGLTKTGYYKKLFRSLKFYNQASFQTPDAINQVLDIIGIEHKNKATSYAPYQNYEFADRVGGGKFTLCYNPVCINIEKYQEMALANRTNEAVKAYEEANLMDGKLVVVMPCRYDYSKKHDLLLDGALALAQQTPELAKKLRVVLIGGGSRTDIKAYADYNQLIIKKIKDINAYCKGRGICTEEKPIIVDIGKMERAVLAGVLGLGRQVVWTAGVDGMNLAALEGLAAGQAGVKQQGGQNKGVYDNIIVTSKFCGVSRLMGERIITLGETLSERQVAIKEIVECLTHLMSIDKIKNYQINGKVLTNIKENFSGINWMKTNVRLFPSASNKEVYPSPSMRKRTLQENINQRKEETRMILDNKPFARTDI